MRFIDKIYLQEEFSEWEKIHPMSALPAFDGENNPEVSKLKVELRGLLIRQQYGLCAYCESRVSKDNSHIEHVEPRHGAEGSQLIFNEWFTDNLVCSCSPEIRSDNVNLHCGHHKKNKSLPFTPLGTDCADKFVYRADGSIAPQAPNDNEALAVIQILNLNCPSLCSKRKAAIRPYFEESLSELDFNQFVEESLKVDSNGELIPYWSAVKCICGTQTRI